MAWMAAHRQMHHQHLPNRGSACAVARHRPCIDGNRRHRAV